MAEPLHVAIESYRPLLAAERGRRRQWQWLAAAAVLLVAIGAIFVTTTMRHSELPVLLSTAVGEYRTTVLADGSEVKLNSNSQLEVSYTRDMRRVRLLKGEVYFTVAHDKSTPFVVFAQEKYVRAVGTEFSVRLAGQDLDVLVTDGVVELNDASSLPTGSAPVVPTAIEIRVPVRLRVGQSVTVSLEEDLRPAASTNIVVHSDREVQRLLAWREGLLDFSRTPLKDVVEEVGRHTHLQIEIADPALGELQFDGIFRVGQVDQLLDALGATFNVKVEKIDAHHVRLSKE